MELLFPAQRPEEVGSKSVITYSFTAGLVNPLQLQP